MSLSHYRLGRQGGQPDFFLATTCASGRPCSNYVMSMVDSTAYLTSQGIAFDYWLHSEDCHVDDARNALVMQFMQTKAPYMVFIDDDVGWDAESLARLVLYKDADIVGGAYPLKQQSEDYPVRIIKDKDMWSRPDGLLEVEGVPTGFMRIARPVLEALAEKRKHLIYRPASTQDDDLRAQVIFERMMVDGKRWSGDLNFCREARLLGFKVWVAPEMTFTHMGNQRYEGHLGKWLRKKQGILDPRLDAAIERLTTGDNSLEVFNEIFTSYNMPYAACSAMLKDTYDMAREANGPILEVGSGITTVVAGLAVQRTGQTVHALEHDIDWFRTVRNYIEIWKVKGVNLYYAPLQEYPQADMKHPLMWYEIDDRLPKDFALAIIDGPPRRYGREGVYRLALDRIKNAKWIVDDTDDAQQRALVEKYAGELGKKVEQRVPALKGVRQYAVCS